MAAEGRTLFPPVSLLLGLDGGLEADRPPGERVGPGVDGDPERPARQLLYVTLGNSRHIGRVTRVGDVRFTKRSAGEARAGPKRPLTWEPVSGIEPLTCRLQEVRLRVLDALAARIARLIALTAVTVLRLTDAPFHKPFHEGWRAPLEIGN